MSTPFSLSLSCHVQRSSGLIESILVHGLIEAFDDSNITFLCKLPPSISVEVVNSYPIKVVKLPGSLCSFADLATSAQADLWIS